MELEGAEDGNVSTLGLKVFFEPNWPLIMQ
jgi:hypothetical protein